MRSLSESFSCWSLYTSVRAPAKTTGVIIDSSRCSSACSGTRDWMNSVACAGSTPAASQSITMSHTWLLDGVRIIVVRGERMPVGDKIKALEFVLQAHPVFEYAVIVAQMQCASGAHAGEYAVYEHGFILPGHQHGEFIKINRTKRSTQVPTRRRW